MSMIASQFGRPHGPLGRLVGRIMAKSNAAFSVWVVGEIEKAYATEASRIIELGSGPGVGLAETLRMFPNAHVWGIDPSREMVSQAQNRNASAIRAGRLIVVHGDPSSLESLGPVDIVFANHVLYFWHEPVKELQRLRQAVRSGGLVALGYQLKGNMPSMAQTQFPRLGHILYETEGDVETLFRDAGFGSVTHRLKGSTEKPEGRLTFAVTE
jgi:trans-aconitate methyltransferase